MCSYKWLGNSDQCYRSYTAIPLRIYRSQMFEWDLIVSALCLLSYTGGGSQHWSWLPGKTSTVTVFPNLLPSMCLSPAMKRNREEVSWRALCQFFCPFQWLIITDWGLRKSADCNLCQKRQAVVWKTMSQALQRWAPPGPAFCWAQVWCSPCQV